jgi:hypothetical protein
MENGDLTERMKEIYEEITSLTDEVCRTQLNDEYAELARQMTELLASFSESPLERGKREIWAAGIVYALGYVNFLFDTYRDPYLSADELCQAFGVKKSSAYQKSVLIRNNLEIFQFDPRWTLPSMQDENPYNWMIEVDGFVLDTRYAPKEIQEIAYQKGLIPYVPDGRVAIGSFEPVADEETTENLLRVQEENSRDKKKGKRKQPPPDPSQLSLDI